MRALTSIDENCSGCRLCEVACTLRHYNVDNPKKSAVKVYQRFPKPGLNEPVFCRQCKSPPCVDACEPRALSRGRDGVIKIDHSRCDGCGSCAKGCPFGAVFFHRDQRYPIICDLCGGEPECARICPNRAIFYVPEGSLGENRRTWLVERQDLARRI